MLKSYQRLVTILWKESIQVLRDWRTLAMTFFLPLFELLLFALAVHLTVNHIPLALFDQSKDAQSRALVQSLVNSSYFDLKFYSASEQQVLDAIDSGQARAGMIIPPNFTSHVAQGNANVLFLLDGSDAFTVQSGFSTANVIAQQYALNIALKNLEKAGNASAGSAAPITTLLQILYNPDNKDLIFILPGLVGIVIQLLAIGNAALVVVREREAGILEQLLTTPLRPLELMIGKLVPNLVVTLLDVFLLVAVGVWFFQVPFKGSVWLFLWLAILFVISSLGLGLLVSTIAQTQRQAQQFSNIFTLFSMVLTGFLYPLASMPAIPRIIAELLPLTYFLRIVRGIITKGVGLQLLWQDALVLVIYGFGILILASLTFRKRLD
jgi:ABC-2 type transport system permease protein